MKLSVNLIFQALGLIVQYGNFASGMVPPKAQPYVSLVVALAQAAVAWKAHTVNPDGTPAAQPYQPK
jgi:hypothetical protein